MLTKITENCILQPKMKTMFKAKFIFVFLFIAILSCGPDDDDDDNLVPPRDRGEEAIAAQAEIEEFLATHFYNYEEFENPSADFDYKVVIDSIAGDNSDKTPLLEQVTFKLVNDRVDTDVEYKLYYLNVLQGEGESPNFTDIALVKYEGLKLDLETFDGSDVPVAFDLPNYTLNNQARGLINGMQDVLVEFNAASTFTDNPDGTVSFENFGVGAVFIPSGLAYYNSSSSSYGFYEQLVFTFQVLERIVGDQDGDGVLSIHEDINNNGLEEDDDTDGDGRVNIGDPDDDGDGIPTREEILDANGNLITDPALYPDVDNDGTPDYLDADS